MRGSDSEQQRRGERGGEGEAYINVVLFRLKRRCTVGDMDEEMVDEIAEPFLAVEIDLDYEFDAARYFDFSRDESPAEARQAELWFESAKSYPPSRKRLSTEP